MTKLTFFASINIISLYLINTNFYCFFFNSFNIFNLNLDSNISNNNNNNIIVNENKSNKWFAFLKLTSQETRLPLIAVKSSGDRKIATRVFSVKDN